MLNCSTLVKRVLEWRPCTFKCALKPTETAAAAVISPLNHHHDWTRTFSTASPSLLTRQIRADKRQPTLSPTKDYQALVESYQCKVPDHFNIGVEICDRHVAQGFGEDLAIIYHNTSGEARKYSFSAMKEMSDRFANAFRHRCQIQPGDRVAIYLPQCPETALTHISVYKLGAIALPLFTLFGPEAVQFRLSNSGARAVVTDEHGLQIVLGIRDQLPQLQSIVVVRSESLASANGSTNGPKSTPPGVYDFNELVNEGSPRLTVHQTKAEDPAVIIYTSGTTGTPKGCVHAHRVLLGHLPGVEMPQNFFPQPNDLFWTPADWAWIGGLLDVLLPSLYYRVPVLAHRARKFDPEECFFLMNKYKVQNAFMPPTALKLIRNVGTKQRYQLRSLGCGGETLGDELLQWARDTFGVTINEFYGQTECNLVLSNCSPCFPVKPGSMGRPVPGKSVAIVDEHGTVQPPNVMGNVAILRPDLSMFLKYWNNPEATAKKFAGNWLLTGDEAKMDEEGYFWFIGRDDDIIKSSGYRIGPGEVEDCLLKHPKVALAAVIGKPDPLRMEIVKAFVVLRQQCKDLSKPESEKLANEIKEFVKSRLAHYEYPREIEFVDQIPMTTTGKLIRKTLKQLEIQRAAQKQDSNAKDSKNTVSV